MIDPTALLRLPRCTRALLGAAALALASCAGAPAGDGLTPHEAARLTRLEAALARSPQRLRDPQLEAYLSDLLDRLAVDVRPRIYLVDRPAPQADLLGARVLRLRRGLLAALHEESELAFVLAHELAHGSLDHIGARRQPGWDALAAERQADGEAFQRLQRAGLDAQAGARLLDRFLAQTNDPEGRLALASRLAALRSRAPSAPAGVDARDPRFDAIRARYATRTGSD